MDSIEYNLRSLLNGEPLEGHEDVCDYSLEDQIKELASKGVDSKNIPSAFVPKLGKSVVYIAAAVLFNDQNDVLMMQEAKSRYAGQWYLPAGRVEPNEQIIDAVKREVLEETGLDFEPTTLLLVESSQGNWFRFTFTGHVIGGKLKTVAVADKESLQARWVSNIKELDLRAEDCLRLIEVGREYNQKRSQWHGPIFPVINAHHKMLLRVVCAIRRRENNCFHVLVAEDPTAHIPICEINPSRSIHAALKKFMAHIFSDKVPDHRPFGLLAVEHNGVPLHENDGLCLSLLVICRVPLEEAAPNHGYTWLQIDAESESVLMSKSAKHKTLFLNVV